MEPIKLWQNLSNEDQALARRIQIAALVLYVFLQIVNFLLPLAITAIIAFGLYQEFCVNQPKK